LRKRLKILKQNHPQVNKYLGIQSIFNFRQA